MGLLWRARYWTGQQVSSGHDAVMEVSTARGKARRPATIPLYRSRPQPARHGPHARRDGHGEITQPVSTQWPEGGTTCYDPTMTMKALASFSMPTSMQHCTPISGGGSQRLSGGSTLSVKSLRKLVTNSLFLRNLPAAGGGGVRRPVRRQAVEFSLWLDHALELQSGSEAAGRYRRQNWKTGHAESA